MKMLTNTCRPAGGGSVRAVKRPCLREHGNDLLLFFFTMPRRVFFFDFGSVVLEGQFIAL